MPVMQVMYGQDTLAWLPSHTLVINVSLKEPAWIEAESQKSDTWDLEYCPHSDSNLCFNLNDSALHVCWNPPKTGISWEISSTFQVINSKTNCLSWNMLLCLVQTEFKVHRYGERTFFFLFFWQTSKLIPFKFWPKIHLSNKVFFE